MDQNNCAMQQSGRSVDSGEAGTPVTLLPNPGEGGPVDSGGDDMAGVPVIPLPNPGEGGPVDSGGNDMAGVPVIPLPNPGEGGPVDSGGNDMAGVPVIPLPNPGEGGPVYPGNSGNCANNCGNNCGNNRPNNRPSLNLPSIWPIRPGNSSNVNNGSSSNNNNSSGNIIYWPESGQGTSQVRFLNAAYGYPSFRISVGNTRVVNMLNYASATTYSQFSSGYRAVTVAGPDGYIYIQKSMPFPANGLTTIAIINTASGMDLLQITDSCCMSANGYGSFRIGNLAYNSGPLDVLLSDGRVVFSDVRYKEVTAFKRIRNGTYRFFYADTDQTPIPYATDIETLDSAWLGIYPPTETFGSLYLNVTGRNLYSVYILQSGTGRNNIQNLIITDQ